MANYAETSDVEAEFKNIEFTNSTLVTSTNVENFITQSSSLINTYIGQRYTLPIVGEDNLVLLKMYCIVLVSERVKGILEVKQKTASETNQNVKSGLSVRDVLRALEQIKNGELLLSGEALLSSDAGFYSNNFVNNVEPVFSKDSESW